MDSGGAFTWSKSIQRVTSRASSPFLLPEPLKNLLPGVGKWERATRSIPLAKAQRGA